MNTTTALIVGGAALAGAGVWYFSRPRPAYASPTVASDPAALRAQYGARAVATAGSGGLASLVNQAMSSYTNLQAAGASAWANKFVPGSGAIVGQGTRLLTQVTTGLVVKGGAKVADAVVSGIKSLKFW